MAIVDRPLYSDSATGKIRNTLSFFKRGIWDRVSSIAYHKQVYSPAQQALRETYRAAVVQWHGMTQQEKDVYNAAATGMLTGFNLFMSGYLIPPTPPVPPPWVGDWIYRKSNSPSRPSGAVTNYQMKLLVGESAGADGANVHCNGHVLPSFNDLRFTASDEETLLDYWIESISGVTPNQIATVWIEVHSIGVDPTPLYMYYGKATAPAASSGVDTFIRFDDFERGVNGDPVGGIWIVMTGSIVISTEQKFSGTRSMKLVGSGGVVNGRITLIPSPDQSIYFRCFKADLAGIQFQHGNGVKSAYPYAGPDEYIYYWTTGANNTGIAMVHDAWCSFEFNDFNHTAGTFDIWYNGSKIKDNAGMFTTAGYNNMFYVYNASAPAGAHTYLDNVIVRNWRATGPAWGAWGSEETKPA